MGGGRVVLRGGVIGGNAGGGGLGKSDAKSGFVENEGGGKPTVEKASRVSGRATMNALASAVAVWVLLDAVPVGGGVW